MDIASAQAWAESEFGRTELGDTRRTQRLVAMAREAVRRPGGTVTSVVHGKAEREGAFRFLANTAIDVKAMSRASSRSTIERSRGLRWAWVAVDQSNVSMTDRQGAKDFGRITGVGCTRGLEVMNALAIAPSGTPLGLMSQQWWRRGDEKSPTYRQDKRPVEERESGLWRRTLQDCCQQLSEVEDAPSPWFQLDRGGDLSYVLDFAKTCGGWITARSSRNRRLGGTDRLLWDVVKSQKVAARYGLEVAARRGKKKERRPRRLAQMSVRFARVTIDITPNSKRGRDLVPVTAVHVRERNAPPGERIEWMLLTTWPVCNARDARQVVEGYGQRWKVEEFHRCWKSGACQLQSSQLRSMATLKRWATILAAVAARTERLKQLARTKPDVPATDELSRAEIDVAIILSRTRKYEPGQDLTLQQAVTVIAEAGGYTGKSSGGPPGSTTIRRGLDRVTDGVELMQQMGKM